MFDSENRKIKRVLLTGQFVASSRAHVPSSLSSHCLSRGRNSPGSQAGTCPAVRSRTPPGPPYPTGSAQSGLRWVCFSGSTSEHLNVVTHRPVSQEGNRPGHRPREEQKLQRAETPALQLAQEREVHFTVCATG